MTNVSCFFDEFLGTAILLMCVLSFTDRNNGPPPGGLVPLALFLLVLGIGAALGFQTGYAINPARDLGPRIAHAVLPIPGKGGSDWSYAWVPIAGPLLGAVLAGLLVRAMV